MTSQTALASEETWATGRTILVAVTGGIACYKTATLVSKLAQSGASVRVIMTDAATCFVTPLTFEALSGKRVLTSLWESDDRPDAQHISLARDCDLFVIAPATANILAKIAHGLCDDLVSTVACAIPAQTPALLAPAMNADMWANPLVEKNVQILKNWRHWHFVGPESGWQACRTNGAGRMSEPLAILEAIKQHLAG